jgi:hypothetical protein
MATARAVVLSNRKKTRLPSLFVVTLPNGERLQTAIGVLSRMVL